MAIERNQSLGIKQPVRVATTVNITLSGLQTIDDIALNAGDRVLVKNQTTMSQNGIYDVQSGTWTRSNDSNTSVEMNSGFEVIVREGTVNHESLWALKTDGTITLDSTSLEFTQLNAASTGGGTSGDATSIQGSIVVAPTVVNDQQALIYDNATDEFKYGSLGIPKVSSPTAGNIPSLNADGTLSDSGLATSLVGNATKIQGKTVPAPTSANDQQAILFDNSTNSFIYGTVSSGSGGMQPVSGAVANDIPKLNADGTLADSGVSITSIGNATSIQSKTIPAPTVSNDQQTLIYDNSTNAFKYAATGIPKVSSPTSGHIPSLNVDGTLSDSGIATTSIGNATQIQGKSIPAPTSSNDNQVLRYNNTNGQMEWVSRMGLVTGATAGHIPSLNADGSLSDSGIVATSVGNATKIQGASIPSPIAGNNNQVLQYNSSNGQMQWVSILNPIAGGVVGNIPQISSNGTLTDSGTALSAIGNATKIQGKNVPAPTSSNDQQVLTYDNSTNAFKYATPAGGSLNGVWSDFIHSGFIATKDGTNANQLDVTAGIAYLMQADGSLKRYSVNATTFTTSALSTTYYLSINPDGTMYWNTTANNTTNKLSIAQVVTDASGNISTITDVAKREYTTMPNTTADMRNDVGISFNGQYKIVFNSTTGTLDIKYTGV